MIKNTFKKPALRAVAAAAVLGGASMGAMACAYEPYVGSVCTVAFDYCPEGYLPADGRIMQIQQSNVLFALLGNRYGGDGRTTFALPDLRGRTVVGTGQGSGLSPQNLAQASGSETQTLTSAQVAPHVHALSGAQASGSVTTTVVVNGLSTATTGAQVAPAANTANTVGKVGPGQASFYPYSASTAVPLPVTASVNTAGAQAGTVTLPVTGSTSPNVPAAQPFSVVNPRLALTVCIASNGIFPTRP